MLRPPRARGPTAGAPATRPSTSAGRFLPLCRPAPASSILGGTGPADFGPVPPVLIPTRGPGPGPSSRLGTHHEPTVTAGSDVWPVA